MNKKERTVCKLSLLMLLAACALLLVACGKCKHEWGEWSTVTASTCTVQGVRERSCAKCGESEREETAMLSHAFSAYVCNNEATCVAAGSETATCGVCGATDVRATTPDAAKHASDELLTVVAADDAACHVKKRACCGVVVDRGEHELYRFSLALAAGALSCADGVVKTYKCTLCEHTVSDTVYEHIDVEGADFAATAPSVQRILLGTYLTAVGIPYAEEPYIEIAADCLCGAYAGEINLMCGMPVEGELLFDRELSPFSSSNAPDGTTPLRREIITAFYTNNLPPDEGGVSVEYRILFEQRLVTSDDRSVYEVRIGFGYDEETDTVEEERVFVLKETATVASE